MAANPTMTYTFTNGTASNATEVNANFTTLVNWITANAMQLDGTVAFTGIPSGPASDPTTANQLTRKSYVDGKSADVGDIKMGGWAAAPTNWLLCQGQAVSRATYAALFAVVGTSFGVGDGATTFNLPDLQGRSPLGAGTGAGLTARTTGTKVGVEDVTLSAAQSGLVGHNHIQDTHNHTQNTHNHIQDTHYHGSPPHTHGITQTYGSYASGTSSTRNSVTASGDTAFTVAAFGVTTDAVVATNQAATAVNVTQVATNQAVAAAAASASHTNMHPTQVVNFAIRY